MEGRKTMPAETTQEAVVHQSARKRSRDAFERSVAVLRAFRERAMPEEMERIAVRLEQALTPLPHSPERAELLAALTGGQILTVQERLELEAAGVSRYFQRHRELL